MSTIVTRPEIPLQIITPAHVRASINRARRSLEAAASEIVWQIEMEAWRTLGYPSWSAMRDAEYGGAAFMVPSKNRPELVARIRAAGLTQQEIADTAGVDERTIRRDISQSAYAGSGSPVTNSRGQQRPSTYARTTEDDVIDAEVVENGEPVNTETGELTNTPDATTDPAPAAAATTCPTCNGTGQVTR